MNILILGRRRQGKSTLSLALALSRSETVVILDPNRQYPDFERVADSAALDDRLEDSAHYLRVGDPPLVICVDAPDIDAAMSDIGPLLRDKWNEDVALVIDEANSLQRPHSIHPELDLIMRRCKASFTLVQNTHRLVDLHRRTRHLVDSAYFFSCRVPGDLEVLRSEFEVEELAEVLPHLPAHHCVRWWIVGGEVRWEILNQPEIWFIDLHNSNELEEVAV